MIKLMPNARVVVNANDIDERYRIYRTTLSNDDAEEWQICLSVLSSYGLIIYGAIHASAVTAADAYDRFRLTDVVTANKDTVPAIIAICEKVWSNSSSTIDTVDSAIDQILLRKHDLVDDRRWMLIYLYLAQFLDRNVKIIYDASMGSITIDRDRTSIRKGSLLSVELTKHTVTISILPDDEIEPKIIPFKSITNIDGKSDDEIISTVSNIDPHVNSTLFHKNCINSNDDAGVEVMKELAEEHIGAPVIYPTVVANISVVPDVPTTANQMISSAGNMIADAQALQLDNHYSESQTIYDSAKRVADMVEGGVHNDVIALQMGLTVPNTAGEQPIPKSIEQPKDLRSSDMPDLSGISPSTDTPNLNSAVRELITYTSQMVDNLRGLNKKDVPEVDPSITHLLDRFDNNYDTH